MKIKALIIQNDGLYTICLMEEDDGPIISHEDLSIAKSQFIEALKVSCALRDMLSSGKTFSCDIDVEFIMNLNILDSISETGTYMGDEYLSNENSIDEVIGMTGEIVDLFEKELTQEEWNALCVVHRMRLRLNLGIRFDWSKSIDVRGKGISQIVDEEVFLKKEIKFDF